MMDKLYTIGYGNQKPDDFLARLTDAGVNVVLDVRREESGAWCTQYRWGMGNGMDDLMIASGILYLWAPELANTCLNLDDYAWWISTSEGKVKVRALYDEILSYRINPDNVFCILCTERNAYKDGVVNCHRVYVADALVKLLGEDWDVVHL